MSVFFLEIFVFLISSLLNQLSFVFQKMRKKGVLFDNIRNLLQLLQKDAGIFHKQYPSSSIWKTFFAFFDNNIIDEGV